MTSINKVALLLTIFLIPVASFGAPQPLMSASYWGYNPQSGQNDLAMNITYQFPDPKRFGPGPYPLFMWTVATYEWNRDTLSLNFVSQMAARGFVGASIQYHNFNTIQACGDYTVRAQSVYESTRISSAAGVLCSINGVNCNNGIVTAGISQGGALSVLARNYNPNVKASFAMSISDTNKTGIGADLSSCLDDQFTAIPSNRLTIVNGANDTSFGGQDPVTQVSGVTCAAGAMQCWSPDGSGAGWYLVQNSQVLDGNADHCYEMNGDCSLTVFDTNWYLPSTYNWSLKPNLDWLASFGTRRVFSPTGL
jgi:hypothetical protein